MKTKEMKSKSIRKLQVRVVRLEGRRNVRKYPGVKWDFN